MSQRLNSTSCLPPLRAYLDDITTLATTAPCTRQLLRKLQENISWACMNIKLAKLHSISIIKGVLTDLKFFIGDEPIPVVFKQPVKSLGRWFDASLRDKYQMLQLQMEISSGMQVIENTELPGRLKIWCVQFDLLPQVLWPCTLYEVPISTVGKMKRGITNYIKRWVPHCLTSIALYGDCLLRQLPV